MNLIDVSKTFPDHKAAARFLEVMRWPEGVRCLACESDQVTRVFSPTKKQPMREIFSCRECRLQFTVTTGTIFEGSHLGLDKWFMAIAMIVDAKKGVSALQLQQHLGIGSYRTAWFMYHRIRKAMEEGDFLLSGTVEMDETYIGGKTIRRKDRGNRWNKPKDMVIGAIERGGKLKLKHVGQGVYAKASHVKEIAKKHISRDVERIMTDESPIYPIAFDGFIASKHETIRHKTEYVRGDVHTNTIESAFSLLKRGLIGSYHRVSIKHLHRYLSEFEYRFNRRKEADRFEQTLSRMANVSRMQYKELTSEPVAEPF